MKRRFTASVVRDGPWYVASQGESAVESLANLQEALELHLAPPTATVVPDVRPFEVEVEVEVEVGAA